MKTSKEQMAELNARYSALVQEQAKLKEGPMNSVNYVQMENNQAELDKLGVAIIRGMPKNNPPMTETVRSDLEIQYVGETPSLQDLLDRQHELISDKCQIIKNAQEQKIGMTEFLNKVIPQLNKITQEINEISNDPQIIAYEQSLKEQLTLKEHNALPDLPKPPDEDNSVELDPASLGELRKTPIAPGEVEIHWLSDEELEELEHQQDDPADSQTASSRSSSQLSVLNDDDPEEDAEEQQNNNPNPS